MGAGLEDVLTAAGDRYFGIINGLDTELWNPATDGDIAARYSATDLAGKQACRAALCAELGLDPGGPLFAMVGRLDPAEGLRPARRCGAGSARGRRADLRAGHGRPIADRRACRRRPREQPTRLAVEARFDRGLARRMYAGADAFLMPSRFEPCGQGQMIAMRYGTVPVVRATGGLVDTVVDATADPAAGTGFSFGPRIRPR